MNTNRTAVRRDLLEGDRSFIAEDEAPTPETIRESYEIPPQLSDPSAERVLTDVLSGVMTGEREEARARIERKFSTPCERPPIEMHRVTADQEAKCVLYDEGGPHFS